jgi:hypothetical protein
MVTGAKKVESSRTILDFSFAGDIHPILEKWAAENGFKPLSGVEGAIEYKRGGGVMMCPVLLQLRQSDVSVHLETWLQVDLITEFTTLFNAPAQSSLESGTTTLLWREKEMARFYINKLLKELGQQPIP